MLTHRQRIATLLATLGAALAIVLLVHLGEKPVPAQQALPDGVDNWRISQTAYLPGRVARLAVFAGLLPVLFAGVFAGLNFVLGRVLPAGHAPPGTRVRPSGWLLVRPLVYLIPGLLALIVLYALGASNVPLSLLVLAALLGALLVGYWVLRIVRRKLPTPASFATTKQVLYLWLCFVVVAAFIRDPLAMAFYLGLFAYGARWLHPPRNNRARAINAVVLAISALPFAARLYSLIFLGRGILWQMAPQTAYGVWSPWGAVIFLLAAVLWIQFLNASVLRVTAKPSGVPTATRSP